MATPVEVSDDFGGVSAQTSEPGDDFGGVPVQATAGVAPEVQELRDVASDEQRAFEEAHGRLARPGEMEEFEALNPKVLHTIGAVQAGGEVERRAALLRWQAKHSELTPQVAASALRAAAATGYPVDMVVQDLPRFEREFEAQQTDWRVVAAQHPLLADFLLANPARLAMVRDDVQNLSRLEYLLTGRWETLPASEYSKLNPDDRASRMAVEHGSPGTPIRYLATPPVWVSQLRDAIKQQRTIGAQTVYALSAPDQLPRNEDELERAKIQRGEERAFGVVVKTGTLGKEEEAAIRASWKDRARMKLLAEHPFVALPPTPEELARFEQLEPQPDAPWRAALRKRIEGWRQDENRDYGPWARSTIGRVVLGPFKLAPMIGGNVLAVGAGTAAGGPGGGFAAGVAWNSYQNFGPLAYELQQQTDENGNPVDPAKTNAIAGVASIGGATVMQAGLGGIINKLGGGKVLGNATVKAGTELLAERTITQQLGQTAAHFGKDVATGAFGMGIQAGMNKGAEVLATGRGDAGDVVKAITDATREAIPDLLLLSATGSGRAMLAEHGRRAAAREGTLRLAGALEAARASATSERSPEAFKEFVKALDPTGTVHIDVEGWDGYWRGRGVDPAQAAEALLGDGGRGYAEAAATRTDLHVPADRYLLGLGKTEHAVALLPDSRLSLDAPTPRQAEQRAQVQNQATGEEPHRAAVREAEPETLPPDVLGKLEGEERATYENTATVARTEAERELLRRITENQARENQSWFRKERARLEQEVDAEIDRSPVQRALTYLQRDPRPEAGIVDVALGELPAHLLDEHGRPWKLDREEIAARFGEDVAKELPRGVFAGERAEAAPVDDLARLLGFASGDEVVQGLRGMPTRAEAVKAEVQRRLEEKYGRLLLEDPGALAEAALEAVHNEAGARKAFLELLALQRRLDPSAPPPTVTLDAIHETARRMLSDRPHGEIRPGYYLQAERAAARRAYELAAKGDTRKALGEKLAQVMNQELYREARDLRRQLDSGLKRLEGSARAPWRSELGKASPDYRDVHDQVLEAVGVLARPEVPSRRATLDEFLARAAADFQDLGFDVEGLRQVLANPRTWNALTAEEALNLVDAVRSIRHLANQVNEMTVDGRRVNRELVIEEAIATAEKNLEAKPKSPRDPLLVARLGRTIRLAGQHADALNLDIATIAHMLDGGNRDGVWHKVLIDRRLEARDKRNALTKQFLEALIPRFEKSGLDRGRLYGQIDVSKDLPLDPVLAETWQEGPVTRANLLMMALNMGNASNRERFLGGYGWTADQVLSALGKHLNGREWRWVQDVWNALEGLYPEMAKLHEEETGLPPGKIQPLPFQVHLSDGTTVDLQGGYFPARYDPRPGSVKRTGEKQVMHEVADFFQGNYTRAPAVASPHAKARAQHFQDLVNLNWGVVPAHVAQVIQDIAFRRYVKETAAFILNDRLNTTLVQRLGEERAKLLRPWLQSVANSRADSVPEHLHVSNQILGELRSKAATAALGWSLPRALGDLTDPLVAASAGLVRIDYLARAAAKQAAAWGETRRFVLENSGEVRDRLENVRTRFRTAMEEMGSRAGMKNPVLRGLRDTVFWTMELVDRLVLTPIWMARYEQSSTEYRRQGIAPEEAHPKAVRDADDVVRQVMPPNDVADKPAIIRDRGVLGGLLLFYGHANKIGNLYRRRVNDVMRTWHSDEASATDKAGAVAKLAGTVLAVSLVNGLLAEYMAGKGKTDDETLEEWAERKSISALFYPVPIVGGWAEGVTSRLVTGEVKPLSIRTAPGLAFAQRMAEALGKGVEQWVDGDGDAGLAAQQTAELLLAYGAGAPTRQAHDTVTYLHDAATGEAEVRGPLDFLGGVVYGQDKKGSANPLTDLQDLVGGKE